MEEVRSPYRMTVDLNVLDHLAEGLYSSVAAVLTEAVANAWDADARRVDIHMDIEGDIIRIVDDGIGMDQEAINERYLRVGYRRREEGERTPGGRLVMGRKGIGKLSLMSIADVIEVFSKIEGKPPVGLRIDVKDLREEMRSGGKEYCPKPLPTDDVEFRNGHGTQIVVRSLKRKRLRDVAPESIRRRLARRFSVIGSDDFEVTINGERITAADRDDLKFVEYLWAFEGTSIDRSKCPHLKELNTIDSRDTDWPKDWTVRGWIGTVDRPRSLSTPEGNLNSIVVLARGRLVQEDVLPSISGAEVYTKYVTGQIEADFLDDTDRDDIVTSNRQALIEDDERVVALLNFLRRIMRRIAEEWTNLRSEDKVNELRSRFPGVGIWLDEIEGSWKHKAERLLERIATMDLGQDSPNDEEEARRTLLRHAIIGFEMLRLRGNAEELERALADGADAVLRLFANREALEASFYWNIANNRLETIKAFQKLTDDDGTKERVLQEYLFKSLWLLDPAWDRAAGSETMEERLRLTEPFRDDPNTKNRYGRVDIRYRTVAGKHVIVELKRVSTHTNIYDLGKQGRKYVNALKEMLPLEERERANIEVVFVVGKIPNESPDTIRHVMQSVSPGSQILTYEQLIVRAKQAYSEYLERMAKVDRIERILRNLDMREEDEERSQD